jgi:hypothetical protein
MEELKMIQWYYHPTPRKKRLSEIEIFLQCINMASPTRFVCGRGKSDYFHQLRQAYTGLVDWVISETMEPVIGRFQRTAACFYAGIYSSQGQKRKERESFAWLVIPSLFEARNSVAENGFNDDGSGLCGY